MRVLVLALCVFALAGCRLFWLKPGADMATFTADHQACVKSTGTPASGDLLLVKVDAYKACLASRGWQRETGSRIGNPPGYYRGLERDGLVRADELPRQIRTMERR